MTPSTLRSPADTSPSPALLHLLDEDLQFSPSFRRIYSNHLAMMLVALDQLGAPAALLGIRFDRHASDGPERRDDRDELDDLHREVERLGIARAVAEYVPPLVDGPDTALFHPAIRLSYALDVGHTGQTAAALLDWRKRHAALPLPPLERAASGEDRLVDVARRLADHQPGTFPDTYDLPGVARRDDLREALDGLRVDEHTLDDLTAFAIMSHVTAEAFVTLHLVTGARAVRAIAGWLDGDSAAALAAHTARAMAVAYAAVGAPRLLGTAALDTIRQLDLPTPDVIAARVIADRDPHVVKLANVALIEEARTGDPLYRYAAARVVDLVPRST